MLPPGCPSSLLLRGEVSGGAGADPHLRGVPPQGPPRPVLQCEDHLDGSPGGAPQVGAPAHELDQSLGLQGQQERQPTRGRVLAVHGGRVVTPGGRDNI